MDRDLDLEIMLAVAEFELALFTAQDIARSAPIHAINAPNKGLRCAQTERIRRAGIFLAKKMKKLGEMISDSRMVEKAKALDAHMLSSRQALLKEALEKLEEYG
jgi:hypothetical protein